MIRDFVAGVLWGSVVAGVGLGVVSQMTPIGTAEIAVGSEAPKPALPAVSTPTPDEKVSKTAPVASGSEDAKAAEPAVKASGVKTADAAPPPEEKATDGQTAVGAETEVAEASKQDAVEAQTDAPSTMPAKPMPAPVETAPFVPASEAPETLAPKAEPSDVAAPAAENGAPMMPASSESPKAGNTESAPIAEAPPVADATKLPDLQTKEEEDEVLLAPTADVAKPLPTTIVPDAGLPKVSGADNPTLLPDAGINQPVEGVTTGRLPVIADAAPESGTAAVTPEVAADLPPIQRFAAAFDNPSAKPLFAVLLMDPGTADLDRIGLGALPFPVTFVIDPLAENAAEAAATYRAAGKEVVMLVTSLPKGATAADVEQSFASTAQSMPEAVAIIDLATEGFQDDRELASAVVPILKAQGRGLITYERGLNAADQVARREDLAAAVVFRTLDDEGEDTPMIRRYLDRAAFKAAQEGRVVVLGTARPETVAALLEWTVEGRASSVALAPVTAVLTVD